MYGGRLWAGGRDFRGRVGTSDAIAKPLEALLYLKSHIVSHQNSDPTIQNPTPTVECFIRILGPYFRLIITQPHSPHIIPLIMTTPTPPPAVNAAAVSLNAIVGAPTARSSTIENLAFALTLQRKQREFVKSFRAATLSRRRLRASCLIQRFARGIHGWVYTTITLPLALPLPSTDVIGDDIITAATTMDDGPDPLADIRQHIPRLAASTARAIDALRLAEASFDTATNELPSAITLEDNLQLLSTLVWGIPQLRPMQLRSLVTVLHKKRIIVVDKTSGGKSHSIRMLGSLLKGVHFIFHPVLAMTADQMPKFCCGSDLYGLIQAYNLDEVATTRTVQRRIIARLLRLAKDTTTTIFFFCSPQFLVTKQSFLQSIIDLAKKGIVRSISIDEAHLWAKQGSSFREDIRQLKHDFFLPIFRDPKFSPLFFGVTATMSQITRSILSDLTTIGFPPDCRVWADFNQFEQDSIVMNHIVTSDYTRSLKKVVDYLADNEGSAFIYCNSKALTNQLLTPLETKIDERGIVADVIHIHGSLTKEEKFAFTSLLVGAITVPDFHPRALIATAAADVAIDDSRVEYVLNIEFPEDCATAVQRKGRASREGQPAQFTIVASLTGYISKVSQIYRQLDGPDKADNEDDTIGGGYMRATKQKKKAGNDRSFPLSVAQRKKLVSNQLAEFDVVANLYFLNRGCQQRRLQLYLSLGEMDSLPFGMEPCGTSCAVCTKEWFKYFLPFVKDNVIAWLETGLVRDTLPVKATADNLLQLLWKKEHKTDPWLAAIFNRPASRVCKYHVEAFYLHLLANKIITMKRQSGVLNWCLNREPVNLYVDRLCYQNERHWIHMNVIPDGVAILHRIPTLAGINI